VHFDPPAVINEDFKLDAYLKPIAPAIFKLEPITSVYNYHDSILIVLNKKGMGILSLPAFYANPQRPYAYMLAPDDGYTGKAGDQNCIVKDFKGNVWLANDKGLTRFHPKNYLFDTTIPSKPILLSFTSYGDTLSVIDGVIKGLRNKHTNVVIHFDWENSPFLYNNIFFEYQLDKDSLIAVEENQVEFTRLAPGNYSFKLYAVKGNVRSEPLLLSFRIPPLWYQNPLILGGIILFLIFIIIIIIAWYQNKLKQERILGELKEQQERQRRELLTVRVQAIVNQLNPHFIINALTWLQVRAQRSNDLSSVSIIERLAENLKIIFINSREKRAFHTLWDEMQLVENYFRIQKVRFGDKVTYHLPDSELIKKWGQCVRVPLMLLLIHVENAIEHGLKKKRGGGCVKITIEDKSKDYLIFTIEDTGIGRKKAGEIPSISTRQGTKMLAELIAIFNSKNDQKITQYYEDEIFIDLHGCPYGTRIIIQLPKIYTYALSD
ncbi:MAG: sensor histidine kinase, partial [Saprospiraceae bacterium]